jgi:sialic acid synthase SpsE
MKIKIKNRVISDYNKPFYVAEAGINHDGDFKKCFKLIDAAKEAGADAIKFQSHIAEHEMIDTNITLAHSSKETVFQLMKKCELSETEN